MSILRRADKPATGVVDTVQRQTSEAAALAHIDGQERLADPRTNPVVRPHADRLQNEQQLAALDAAHTRKLRTHRVADRRAAHAERALEAIQAARETSSAAQSVLALHKGRTRFMGATMAMSLTLSIGSAMGVEQFATDNHAPGGVGYIAEVGLTGLATTAILYRSHLAQHDGKVTGWHEKALYALMFGPLIASMIANFQGAGPIGIACSVGAAAFALLSDLVATSSSSALRKKANEVTGEDETALRAVASDGDLAPLDRVRTQVSLQVPDLTAAGSETSTTDPDPMRSETHSTDRSVARSETHGTDRSETHMADRSVDQVSDPLVEKVPDPGPIAVETPRQTQTQTGPKKPTRTRRKAEPQPKLKPLDRIDEARTADAAYLAEHGRHIPAEKLARAMRINKPAALELVKQVRGAQMDIAK